MAGNRIQELEQRLLPHLDSGVCPIYVRRLPPCRNACPSSEDVRGYLTGLAQTELFGRTFQESADEAWYLLTDKNPFPAVIGRICPHPCESACNRKRHDWPLAINNLERFIGDWGLERGLKLRRRIAAPKEERVAVVGAGPSGLSCAYQLTQRGYPVTVFDAEPKPGGLLHSVIPRYRLPLEILEAEIASIVSLGMDIQMSTRLGTDVELEDLRADYDAVYVALGSGEGMPLGIEGEDQPGVISAMDFLRSANSGEFHPPGGQALVIGGGNAAIDAARVARRLGMEVALAYRRARFDMPAIAGETREAEQEGVRLEFQQMPEAIVAGDAAAGVLEVRMVRTEPGRPDQSGRRQPLPVAGSGFTVKTDLVISAVGQQSLLDGIESILPPGGGLPALPTSPTALPGVFAGGDLLSPSLATNAIGQGRKAAAAIDAFLRGEVYREPVVPRPIYWPELNLDFYPHLSRHDHGVLPLEERAGNYREVNLALSADEAAAEARRCLSCGRCFVCDRCRIYCPREAISKNLSRPVGFNMFTDYAKCSGCTICSMTCPSNYIQMGFRT
ncbi:MAG: NAD(P)-binding protein [Thermoleophilia bacterium]